MTVDPSQAEKVLAAIAKEYGDTIHSGENFPAVPRIPTGSLALDFATQGGIPIGRFTRLYGGYSGGKSLIGWFTIRAAQKMGMHCAYYNVEKQFDPKYVKALGVDIDPPALRIVDGTEMEEIGEKLEALLGVIHVHVVDSCSAAVSQEELASEMSDWHRGLGARVWGKVFRKANSRFNYQENTVVLIDQLRASMAYQSEGQPPGGKIMEHISSMSIRIKKGKWLFYNDKGILEPDGGNEKITLSQSKEADGYEITAHVEKSRVGRPLRVARMRYDFKKKELDGLYELSRAARHFEMVERNGAWYTLPDQTKVQGEAGLREVIEKHPEFQKQIIEKMKEEM